MSTNIQSYRILIWSENPDKLSDFYQKVLGFPLVTSLDIPDDYGFLLKVNDTQMIWVGRHSEVTGKNKDPMRHIFNLYVDDVQKWYEKIKDINEIKVIQTPMVTPPTRESEEKKYVCTFLDPEDNCFQFMNP